MIHARYAVRFAVIVTVTWLFVNLVNAAMANAQDAADALPDPEVPALQLPAFSALRRGQPSPADGLFVTFEQMAQIRLDYDALAAQLVRDLERAGQQCELRVEGERLRIRSAEENLALHTRLWEGRQGELLERATQAEERAVRQWYENPGLWAGVGAVAAAAVAILVSQVD